MEKRMSITYIPGRWGGYSIPYEGKFAINTGGNTSGTGAFNYGVLDIISGIDYNSTKDFSAEKVKKILEEVEGIKNMIGKFYNEMGEIKKEMLAPKDGIKCDRCKVIDNLTAMIDGTYRCDRCIDKSSDIESRNSAIANKSKKINENIESIAKMSSFVEELIKTFKEREINSNSMMDGYLGAPFDFTKAFYKVKL